MREQYERAHREARENRRNGRWLHNPIRLVDGWPGLFVRADGQVCHFAKFSPDTCEMFPAGRGNK